MDEDEEPNEDEDEEAGNQIEVGTVVPYRDSDSESEPEQLRSVSEFDLLSGSDEEESTAPAALVFSYARGRGREHAVAWDGRILYSSSDSDDNTLPYNLASGRRQSRTSSAISRRDCRPARPGSRPTTRQNRWIIPAWGRTLVVKVRNLKK